MCSLGVIYCHLLDGSHFLQCAHWESFCCHVLIGNEILYSFGIIFMCSLGVGVCDVLFVVFVLFCLLLPCVCWESSSAVCSLKSSFMHLSGAICHVLIDILLSCVWGKGGRGWGGEGASHMSAIAIIHCLVLLSVICRPQLCAYWWSYTYIVGWLAVIYWHSLLLWLYVILWNVLSN